jgi:photosystem II stability/assembly factor-like uncharacterized protein
MSRILILMVFLAAACGGGATTSPAPQPSSSAVAASPSPSARATGTPIILPSFAQVSAPSSSVAWMLVAGSRLFRSVDRGDSWDEHALPSLARSPAISFVSEREGWVASVETSGTSCQSQPIALWHTTDAAASWQQVAATGITAPTCNASLSFIDAQRGFVAALDQKSGPVIYRTSDGAKTWSASGPLPDPPGLPMQGGRPDLQLGRVRAVGSTLLVVASLAAQAGPSTHVYRSQDGGATWTYAAAIPSAGTLAIVTASRWLRIGPPGASFESTDAAATWHPYATDYAQAAPIAPDIAFADANVGYATVRGGLQRTIDGGAHWTTLKTPGTE